MSNLDWMDKAACRGKDPDIFFADNGSYSQANQICAQCPVKPQCAAFALHAEGGACHNQRYGAWAGTTPRARAKAAGAGTARRRLVEQILRLDARGMNPNDIAEVVGVSPRTVFRIKNRHGRTERAAA